MPNRLERYSYNTVKSATQIGGKTHSTTEFEGGFMFSINTNLQSLVAQNSLKTSTLKLNTSIERLTTGYKINHTKDNAANFSITNNMSTKNWSLSNRRRQLCYGIRLD